MRLATILTTLTFAVFACTADGQEKKEQKEVSPLATQEQLLAWVLAEAAKIPPPDLSNDIAKREAAAELAKACETLVGKMVNWEFKVTAVKTLKGKDYVVVPTAADKQEHKLSFAVKDGIFGAQFDLVHVPLSQADLQWARLLRNGDVVTLTGKIKAVSVRDSGGSIQPLPHQLSLVFVHLVDWKMKPPMKK